MRPHNVKTGVLLALVCLGLLGTMPIVSGSRPEAFGALAFAFLLSVWQVVFALPLVATECVPTRKGLLAAGVAAPVRRRALLVGLFTGTLFGAATYLYVLGIDKAGAVSTAIAIQAYPLFAILVESMFLKRRKAPAELALTLILLGVLYYLGTGGTGRIDGFSPWFLVALGVPLLWSIAHVIIREELTATPITPAQVTFFRVAVSAVFLGAVLAVADAGAIRAAVGRTDFQVYAAVMGLVYYLELIFWFHAMRHVDVSLASSITTPWPALTMVLAVVFLNERIAAHQIVAFVIAAGCIYGLILCGLRKENRAAA